MTDGDKLLQAVLKTPDDDTVRLVYADYLQENAGSVACPRCNGGKKLAGVNRAAYTKPPLQPKDLCSVCHGESTVSDGLKERAEFIRVQIELDKTPLFEDDYENCPVCAGDGMSDPPPYHRACRPCNGTGKKNHVAYNRAGDLVRRERKLWHGYALNWFPSSARTPFSAVGTSGADGSIDIGTLTGSSMKGDVFAVRRGFIDDVRAESWKLFGGLCRVCDNDPTLTACAYCGDSEGTPTGTTNGFAYRLFSAHPISRVTLADKEPGEDRTDWCWERKRHNNDINNPHVLSYALWEATKRTRRHTNLKGSGVWLYYDGEEDARRALSDGCVLLGRELVDWLNEKG